MEAEAEAEAKKDLKMEAEAEAVQKFGASTSLLLGAFLDGGGAIPPRNCWSQMELESRTVGQGGA